MKVLLSAFACEPDLGSESAVGWNWAVSLARAGHEVTVLTRSLSRAQIERAAGSITSLPLRFEYFDVPKGMRWQVRGPLHVHNALWQWLAWRHARELHRRERFDRVHHVTYAGMRAPSFMGKLGIPFVFGPVGGGERAPWRLRYGYSPFGFAYDAARDLANALIPFTPFMNATFQGAERIYVTSAETLRVIPARFRSKARIELAIAADETCDSSTPRPVSSARPFRLLFAGRFVDYKGMHIGLPAFAHMARRFPDARLTMVGDGPLKRRWETMAVRLGIQSQIDWVGWQDRASMPQVYRDHDALLFPAMHDSGGMVALEAMASGIPVVCLKLGGPATLVDDRCGCVIDPTDRSAAQAAREMGDALIRLADLSIRASFADAARRRCHNFTWPEKVARLYGLPS